MLAVQQRQKLTEKARPKLRELMGDRRFRRHFRPHEPRYASVLSTGSSELDALLPQGGLPRGRLTTVSGARGSGRTTFVLSLIAQLARRGERTAIIDLDQDLDPSSFAATTQTGSDALELAFPSDTVWVIAPDQHSDALWAADLVLRSGQFGLVVLDGISAHIRTSDLVRLQRQAKESDVVLLVGTGQRQIGAPGGLQLRFRPLGLDWESGLKSPTGPSCLRFAVQLGKGHGEVTLEFPCQRQPLLNRHKHIADRREAKWTETSPYPDFGNGSSSKSEAPVRSLQLVATG